MANSASIPQTVATAPTANWARSNEPAPASNGSSRGRGRGLGRGRGRGGRGGARDTKPTGPDSTNDKTNIASKSTASASKPVAAHPPPLPDIKPSTPTTTSSPARPKGGSRRPSRTISATILPDSNATADASNSPKLTRPPNRGRRSQSGKPIPNNLTKINVPAHDDNLVRPHRPRVGQLPHTAPIKDTPPHLLGSSFDIRNNIDALVERVRAVAMAENRPSTPGSHIDWAGDDDDSLPDLDDWGVTPATIAADKTEMISPIVVDGLKTLPDMHIEPSVPLPLKSSSTSGEPVSGRPHVEKSIDKTPGVATAPLAQRSSFSKPDVEDLTIPVTMTQQPLVSAPGLAKVFLHPSLPAKPVEASNMPPFPRPGPGASPMRQQFPLSSANIGEKPVPTNAQITMEDATVPIAILEGGATEGKVMESKHAPPNPDAKNADLFANLLARDGLTASIHAPGQTSGLKSAPSNISSYSPPMPDYRTHTRAHTVGRPYRPDNNGRPSRSGYNTPRAVHPTEGGYHSRTHSTPPTGQLSHRTAAHRPVITGDAITRLARTIGSTTISAGRAATVSAAQD